MKPNVILESIKEHVEKAKQELLTALADNVFNKYKRGTNFTDDLYRVAQELNEITRLLDD
jgi:hypothetical protein